MVTKDEGLWGLPDSEIITYLTIAENKSHNIYGNNNSEKCYSIILRNKGLENDFNLLKLTNGLIYHGVHALKVLNIPGLIESVTVTKVDIDCLQEPCSIKRTIKN